MLKPEKLHEGRWWDRAWGLVGGCSPVSPACDHCWAAREAHMRAGQANPKIRAMYVGLTGEDGRFNGRVRINRDALRLPESVGKPTVWAVWNDLFHEDVSDGFIGEVWLAMARSPRHTFVVLTKRAPRMREFVELAVKVWGEKAAVLPNVVLGVTVESQEYVPRVLDLLATPAATRFVSVEPMLGPVDLRPWLPDEEWFSILRESGVAPHPRLAWIVVGGESGPGARPTNPHWALDLCYQCVAAGVPFYFKRMGNVWEREHGGEKVPDGLMVRELPF